MKYALILAVLLLAGCSSSTPYGQCVGLGDEKDPKLVYKPSVRNLIVGAVFVELIAPPIIVAVDEFYCPIGKK
jgi:hypothetical protein